MSLPPSSTLLLHRRLKQRRSLGKGQVAVHGVFPLLRVALLAFAASSPISVLAVRCAFRHDQRRSAQPSRGGLWRLFEAGGKPDAVARERALPSANEYRTDEEGPWKSDS